MKKNILGKTGIEVTELCFGALPMGPLQKNMDLESSTKVVAHALQKGINFVDTAQMYLFSPLIELEKKFDNVRMLIRGYEIEKETL